MAITSRNKEIRIGIVGFGGAGMAEYSHFSKMPGCRVTAVYDPKPGGVQRAIDTDHSMFATSDFRQFMESEIDAIAVCSPDSSHADYLITALQSGRHVVVEKPLTDSLDGCRRILAAEANAKGLVAAVQHQMRFLPVHLGMKEIIEKRELGRISYIEGYYVHNLTERASRYDDWRFKENATPLVYSGCHFVDLLRWLLNDEVEEVMGMANNIAFPEYPESDLNVILMRFKSGIIGKIVVAFGAGRPQDHSVRVYGSEKSIENNLLFSKDWSYSVFARPLRGKIRDPSGAHTGFRLRGLGYRDTLLGRAMEYLMRLHSGSREYSISAYPIRLYEHGLAVRRSLQNFISAIRGEQPLVCGLSDAARTVATCLAGVEAYRTGRMVKVADCWLPELR